MDLFHGLFLLNFKTGITSYLKMPIYYIEKKRSVCP